MRIITSIFAAVALTLAVPVFAQDEPTPAASPEETASASVEATAEATPEAKSAPVMTEKSAARSESRREENCAGQRCRWREEGGCQFRLTRFQKARSIRRDRRKENECGSVHPGDGEQVGG